MSWVVRIQGLKRDGSEPGVSRRVNNEDHKREVLRNSKIDNLVAYSLLDPAFSKTKNATILLFGVPVLLRLYFVFFKRHRHLMMFIIGGSIFGLGYYYSYCKCHDMEKFIRRDTVVANSMRDLLRDEMIDRQSWSDHSSITKQIIVNRAFALDYQLPKPQKIQEEKQSKFLPKPKA